MFTLVKLMCVCWLCTIMMMMSFLNMVALFLSKIRTSESILYLLIQYCCIEYAEVTVIGCGQINDANEKSFKKK